MSHIYSVLVLNKVPKPTRPGHLCLSLQSKYSIAVLFVFIAVSAVVYWYFVSMERTATLWSSRLGIFYILSLVVLGCLFFLFQFTQYSVSQNNTYTKRN